MTAPAQRQDDETEFEALLEREVKRAMAAGFAEGRKHQRELDLAALRDIVKFSEFCRRHKHMFIISNRGLEITSRTAIEYLKWLKVES